ncbi:MAG TPA: hypothetical protein VIS55_08885 [Pseudomonadales bacterium]|jgi:hypothetical protein
MLARLRTASVNALCLGIALLVVVGGGSARGAQPNGIDGAFGETSKAEARVTLRIRSGARIVRGPGTGGRPDAPPGGGRGRPDLNLSSRDLSETGEAVLPLCLNAPSGQAFEVSALPDGGDEASGLRTASGSAVSYEVSLGAEGGASATFISSGRDCTPENSLRLSISTTRSAPDTELTNLTGHVRLFVVPV